jgi:hypothetical protein
LSSAWSDLDAISSLRRGCCNGCVETDPKLDGS